MIDNFTKPPKPTNNGQDEEQDNFITPEEAAARDEIDDTIDMGEEQSSEEIPSQIQNDTPKPPKKRWWTRFNEWFVGLNKKQKTLFVICSIALLCAIGIGAYTLFFKGSDPIISIKQPTKVAKADTIKSNLTGLEVAPEVNEKPVTGVMIENSVDARPQAGLSEAGVVFEAIAEGGITRFLALYQDTSPESVGPIRSIRPYYIDWGLGFDAAFAHVGGSPEALQRIKSESIKDLDQSYNASSFQRISSRYAPHNVFTSINSLNELEKSKNYGKSSFTSLPRKKDSPSKATEATAKNVTLNISSQRFNVQYAYDAASNTYLRNLAGTAHIDEKTNKQIAPKVVIAVVMNHGTAADRLHSTYNTIGSGQVYIFQDGTVTEGTWEKTDTKKQITFTDAAGKTIKLNPGQTWITAVNTPNSVSYSP